jgi:4-hydroxybenzoate polyprenyltransferase
LALVEGLGWISMVGVGVVAALLAYEHRLVRPDDFSRVNAAFFTMNGYISALFFVFWALDLALLR